MSKSYFHEIVLYQGGHMLIKIMFTLEDIKVKFIFLNANLIF